ncbi:MAG TPA: insulinase family protein [Caulobacteraceae bacterium]|nr:insulinase family protein [Caulobacteraceae bacterium]
MRRVFAAAFVALAIGLAGAAVAAPQVPPGEPPDDLVKPDPDVLIGQLPNGMRYAIARTVGLPETTIDFYMGAGSADETDAEQGTAHFLEHMTFSGSNHFPPGTLLPQFEQIGVALGRDQNAQTGLTGTTFSLDIDSSSDEKVDLAFNWLQDAADGLTIAQSEVDRERGTILSEYRESLSPASEISKQVGLFMLPELRGSHRLPIGTLERINAASSDSIRAFWKKWYRPEDAILIVVSDQPGEAIRERIERTFGAWRDAGPAPAKPALGHVDAKRGLDAMTVTSADVPALLQVCRARDKDPDHVEDVGVHMLDLEDQIWTAALTRRLDRLARAPSPTIVAGAASRDVIYDTASLTCVQVSVRDGEWRPALKTLSEETRRMAAYGVTDQEMDQTRAELRAKLDAGLAGGNNMMQKARADLILANFLHAGTVDTVEEDYRVVTTALSRLTPALVDGEFRRVWSDANGPLIFMVTPAPVEAAEVRKAWAADEAEPKPAPPSALVGHAWAYTDFGPPGKIAHREALSDISAERVEFANGVRVNFKSVDNMPDKVFVRIRFGAGQQELPAGSAFAAAFGAQMLGAGGLGKNDLEDISQLCATHTCDLRMSVGRDSFLLEGATRVADLDTQLQLLTAFLTDPGFRPALDAQIPTAIRTAYRELEIAPDAVANRALQGALVPPRVLQMPSEAEAAKLTSTDFARLLAPPLKTDALEVTIVGDVDETTAIGAVAKTLGAIPPRQRIDRARPDAPHVRFPDPAPPPIHVTHEGPSDETGILMAWPLFVWTPDKIREERTLEVLGAMLQDEIIDLVRRKHGKTYSPSVRVDFARGGDQGDLAIALITAPADAESVVEETQAIVRRYASGDFDSVALERARRPIVDGGQSRELTVGWWMDTLDQSWAHPDKLDAAKSWQSDFSGVTLADVRAEAKKWLGQTPMVVIAAPKAAR